MRPIVYVGKGPAARPPARSLSRPAHDGRPGPRREPNLQNQLNNTSEGMVAGLFLNLSLSPFSLSVSLSLKSGRGSSTAHRRDARFVEAEPRPGLLPHLLDV